MIQVTFVLLRRTRSALFQAFGELRDPAPGTLADTSGYSPDLSYEQKVQLLQTIDITERLELALQFQRERLAELDSERTR